MYRQGERMRQYVYFTLGYLTALATIFMASCTYAPLEAGSSELGSNRYNPLYVVVIEE